MFTSHLEYVRVASPCSADWHEMYGNERKRFCAECKLNVYNLSDMTRSEAERFVMNAEGRVCVRYFRRRDGTILTRDCPVGWKAVKRRVSRIAAACMSMAAGVFGGVLVTSLFQKTTVSGTPVIELNAVSAPKLNSEITVLVRPDEVYLEQGLPIAGQLVYVPREAERKRLKRKKR